MGSDIKKPRAACVEDCDEEDKAVRGTRRTACTKGKSKGERESRSSKEKYSHRDSGYSSQAVSTGSEKSSSPKTTRVEVVKDEITVDRESRRRSLSGASTRSPRKSSRPPLTRNNVTSPQLEVPSRPRTDPSYFGVSPNTTYTPNSSIRSRPQSYYGGMPLNAAPIAIPASSVAASRPPMARSAFYPTASPVMAGASYPMASPTESYMGYAPSRAGSYIAPELLRARDHLAERFNRADPISRTASAQGVRTIADNFMNQPSFEQDAARNSIRRRAKEAEDSKMMPPPPSRRTSVIDSRSFADGYTFDSYKDSLPYELRPTRVTYREPSPAPRSSHRPSANRSSTYDYAQDITPYRPETSNRHRRSTYYEGQPLSSYEEKIREAKGYQEDVAGGPTVSLTAEALRKQQRTAASSRSTRSSDSRDESDFKRSATTRTTTSRIDGDGEDVTIKFSGSATLNIAGAEIKCDDGAEVNIVRSKSIRNGSERSASDYGTVQTADRRGRDRGTPSYSRSTSKSRFSNPIPVNSRHRPGFF